MNGQICKVTEVFFTKVYLSVSIKKSKIQRKVVATFDYQGILGLDLITKLLIKEFSLDWSIHVMVIL